MPRVHCVRGKVVRARYSGACAVQRNIEPKKKAKQRKKDKNKVKALMIWRRMGGMGFRPHTSAEAAAAAPLLLAARAGLSAVLLLGRGRPPRPAAARCARRTISPRTVVCSSTSPLMLFRGGKKRSWALRQVRHGTEGLHQQRRISKPGLWKVSFPTRMTVCFSWIGMAATCLRAQ